MCTFQFLWFSQSSWTFCYFPQWFLVLVFGFLFCFVFAVLVFGSFYWYILNIRHSYFGHISPTKEPIKVILNYHYSNLDLWHFSLVISLYITFYAYVTHVFLPIVNCPARVPNVIVSLNSWSNYSNICAISKSGLIICCFTYFFFLLECFVTFVQEMDIVGKRNPK